VQYCEACMQCSKSTRWQQGQPSLTY